MEDFYIIEVADLVTMKSKYVSQHMVGLKDKVASFVSYIPVSKLEHADVFTMSEAVRIYKILSTSFEGSSKYALTKRYVDVVKEGSGLL